jgi:hypothetical protein
MSHAFQGMSNENRSVAPSSVVRQRLCEIASKPSRGSEGANPLLASAMARPLGSSSRKGSGEFATSRVPGTLGKSHRSAARIRTWRPRTTSGRKAWSPAMNAGPHQSHNWSDRIINELLKPVSYKIGIRGEFGGRVLSFGSVMLAQRMIWRGRTRKNPPFGVETHCGTDGSASDQGRLSINRDTMSSREGRIVSKMRLRCRRPDRCRL